MPNYTFQITEGPKTQEILIGVKKTLTAFITHKTTFKSGTTHIRPGQLVTVTKNGKNYALLFLHIVSGTNPRGMGLRVMSQTQLNPKIVLVDRHPTLLTHKIIPRVSLTYSPDHASVLCAAFGSVQSQLRFVAHSRNSWNPTLVLWSALSIDGLAQQCLLGICTV